MSIVKFTSTNDTTAAYQQQMFRYITAPVKTEGCIGANACSPEKALPCMQIVKKLYHKIGGRDAIQLILSPTPDTKERADQVYMELGEEIAALFQDFQCYYALHKDSRFRHLHMVFNTVNFRTGAKFSQSRSDLNRFRCKVNTIFTQMGFAPMEQSANSLWDETSYPMTGSFDFLEIAEENGLGIFNQLHSPQQGNTGKSYGSKDFSLYKRPIYAYPPLRNMRYGVQEIPETDDTTPFPPLPGIRYGYQFTSLQPEIYETNYQEGELSMKQNENQVPAPVQEYLETPVFQNDYPCMMIDAGSHLNLHIERPEQVLPVMDSIRQSTAQQMYSAAEAGLAMFHKVHETNCNANIYIDISPKIDIYFSGESSSLLDNRNHEE